MTSTHLQPQTVFEELQSWAAGTQPNPETVGIYAAAAVGFIETLRSTIRSLMGQQFPTSRGVRSRARRAPHLHSWRSVDVALRGGVVREGRQCRSCDEVRMWAS